MESVYVEIRQFAYEYLLCKKMACLDSRTDESVKQAIRSYSREQLDNTINEENITWGRNSPFTQGARRPTPAHIPRPQFHSIWKTDSPISLSEISSLPLVKFANKWKNSFEQAVNLSLQRKFVLHCYIAWLFWINALVYPFIIFCSTINYCE